MFFPHGNNFTHGVKFSVHTISFGIDAYRDVVELFGLTVFGLSFKLSERPKRPDMARLLWSQFCSILYFVIEINFKREHFLKKKFSHIFASKSLLKLADNSAPDGALKIGELHKSYLQLPCVNFKFNSSIWNLVTRSAILFGNNS